MSVPAEAVRRPRTRPRSRIVIAIVVALLAGLPHTGYCNVADFGSADRFDDTIIGAEADLAARLQSIANAGEIVLRYETYALVRELVVAHALAPITVKGISREIVPCAIDGLAQGTGARGGIPSAPGTERER